MAENVAMIDDLKPVPTPSNVIHDIFTLITTHQKERVEAVIPDSVSENLFSPIDNFENNTIRDIFTLIPIDMLSS
jgi:hypothetical protein